MSLSSFLRSNCILKYHDVAVSMSAYGPDDMDSNFRLAKVRYDIIFFLGEFIFLFF